MWDVLRENQIEHNYISTDPLNSTAVFWVAIAIINFSNSSTQLTYNIIHVSSGQGFKTVECIVHYITNVVNCVWIRCAILQE